MLCTECRGSTCRSKDSAAVDVNWSSLWCVRCWVSAASLFFARVPHGNLSTRYLIYFDFLSRSVRVLAISTGVPYFGAVNTKNKIVLNDITDRYY